MGYVMLYMGYVKKGPFNGKIEHRIAPKIVKVSDIKEMKKFGGKMKVKKEREISKKVEIQTLSWKKRSILFNFPYWEVCTLYPH
jgi:hypothetical protein